MEVVASSFANVFVSLSLLSCVLLLISSSFRNFLSGKGWTTRKLLIIQIFLRALPIFLFLILFIRYLHSHLFLNFSHLHVALHLDYDSSIRDRIFSLFSGSDGASIMLMTVVLIVHVTLHLYHDKLPIKNKDMIDRWFSLLWIICLTGILPEQTFSLIENSEPVPVDNSILSSSFKGGLIASLGYGTILGFAPHAMELKSDSKHLRNLLRFLAIYGICLIFFGPIEALTPVASGEWNAELFSEPNVIRLGTIILVLLLFSIMPLFLYYGENLDSTIPAGKNRSLGLGIAILTGLFSLVFFTSIFLYPFWSLVSIFYELIVELFPVLLLSLAFCLLPTLGLDERARPELHGWRYGLFTGLIIGSINSSLLSLSLINGFLLGLFLSLTIPILIEKSPLISLKIKIYFAATLFIFILLSVSLIIILLNTKFVIFVLSIVSILLMELNNSQLPKRKIS